MIIQTHKGILEKVHNAIGRGNVITHKPFDGNILGQSGAHTFADDIMDVIKEVRGGDFVGPKKGQVYRGLVGFLQTLGDFQKEDSQKFCVECLKVGDKCQCK